MIEDSAHAPSATLAGRKLGTWGLAGAFSLFSNKILSVGEGGLLVTDDDDVAAMARSLRSHAMSSGTWDRHTGRTDSYDVAGLGFNYRIDDPRSALALSRMARLEDDIAHRRRLTRRYRSQLTDVPGISVPYLDAAVDDASCYTMPVLVDVDQRDRLRYALRIEHGVQTSVMYPSVHEFTAYRTRFPGVSLPATEHAARAQLCIPLFPDMTEAEQDRVIHAIASKLTA